LFVCAEVAGDGAFEPGSRIRDEQGRGATTSRVCGRRNRADRFGTPLPGGPRTRRGTEPPATNGAKEKRAGAAARSGGGADRRAEVATCTRRRPVETGDAGRRRTQATGR